MLLDDDKADSNHASCLPCCEWDDVSLHSFIHSLTPSFRPFAFVSSFTYPELAKASWLLAHRGLWLGAGALRALGT